MRLSLLVLLVAVTASLAFPPVPPPKKAKPPKGDKIDLKVLEGTWTVVKYEIGRPKNAKPLPLPERSYDRIEIKAGKWVQKRTLPNGGTAQMVPFTITLDTTKSPTVLDMEYTRALPGGGVTSSSKRNGVARLEGDKLIVTYSMAARARPASPDGDLAVGEYRWTLTRAKP
jgi:uncharacterized protein (TIGR03067 family)